jgi:hypothetical protein
MLCCLLQCCFALYCTLLSLFAVRPVLYRSWSKDLNLNSPFSLSLRCLPFSFIPFRDHSSDNKIVENARLLWSSRIVDVLHFASIAWSNVKSPPAGLIKNLFIFLLLLVWSTIDENCYIISPNFYIVCITEIALRDIRKRKTWTFFASLLIKRYEQHEKWLSISGQLLLQKLFRMKNKEKRMGPSIFFYLQNWRLDVNLAFYLQNIHKSFLLDVQI